MSLSLALPNPVKNSYLHVSSSVFSALITVLLLLFYNTAFFGALIENVDYSSVRGCLFILNVTLLLALLTFVIICLIAWPYVAKPLLSVLLLVAACVAYFMDSYGIVMHRLMIQNAVETDVTEVRGLINNTLAFYVVALGVLPSLLMSVMNVKFASVTRELWLKTKHILIALLGCIILIVSMSADYATFFRSHKNIRQMANPVNVIAAGASYLTTSTKPVIVQPIESDAQINAFGKQQLKPTLFVLVVGETARADHFGINGYNRETTPWLKQHNIINFPQVVSCGTETAVSVPCMFSALGRANYSDSKAKAQEGLLDVIHHAGIAVLWRDNNSSCKGVCNRVTYEDVQKLQVPELCNERECFDEILLHNMDEKITAASGSKVIVLHQKGSHGPDYFNRYPGKSEYFTPSCKNNQLQKCTAEEVINAFDNTIRYTDYFLHNTLTWLSTKHQDYNTVLLYLSDHGESLGENHLYLHGMPYAIAPKEQKQVPLFLWFSSGFEKANAIDSNCLRERSSAAYSQDNLFHTVLGLLNINTQVYKPDLDIIKPCKNSTATYGLVEGDLAVDNSAALK
jgi:lipid A ethanolaminephosphotransferase